MLRSATLLACLTCSAFAQTITGTPFANLTLIRQNEANFSSNVALPSFPCDSSSSGLVGGYQPLDLDDVDLSYVSQAVLGYFVKATSNLTECDIIINGVFNTTDACSQVRPQTALARRTQLPPCYCNMCAGCLLLAA